MGLGTIIARCAGVVWMGLCVSSTLAAGGGALNDPQETYTSERPGMAGGGVSASVTIQFVAYALNTVGSKYRLIPVRVWVGDRPAPLLMAIDQDRLHVASGGKKVAASFQLSALDRPFWDSLTPELKKWLTYPEQLSPNSAAVVYAFVPLADLPGPIEGFEYTIKSLAAPLLLMPEAKKAAAQADDAPQG